MDARTRTVTRLLSCKYGMDKQAAPAPYVGPLAFGARAGWGLPYGGKHLGLAGLIAGGLIGGARGAFGEKKRKESRLMAILSGLAGGAAIGGGVGLGAGMLNRGLHPAVDAIKLERETGPGFFNKALNLSDRVGLTDYAIDRGDRDAGSLHKDVAVMAKDWLPSLFKGSADKQAADPGPWERDPMANVSPGDPESRYRWIDRLSPAQRAAYANGSVPLPSNTQQTYSAREAVTPSMRAQTGSTPSAPMPTGGLSAPMPTGGLSAPPGSGAAGGMGMGMGNKYGLDKWALNYGQVAAAGRSFLPMLKNLFSRETGAALRSAGARARSGFLNSIDRGATALAGKAPNSKLLGALAENAGTPAASHAERAFGNALAESRSLPSLGSRRQNLARNVSLGQSFNASGAPAKNTWVNALATLLSDMEGRAAGQSTMAGKNVAQYGHLLDPLNIGRGVQQAGWRGGALRAVAPASAAAGGYGIFHDTE